MCDNNHHLLCEPLRLITKLFPIVSTESFQDVSSRNGFRSQNGLDTRQWSISKFKVFKERCIDILSGLLHATPEENQAHYLHYWMGEEGS